MRLENGKESWVLYSISGWGHNGDWISSTAGFGAHREFSPFVKPNSSFIEELKTMVSEEERDVILCGWSLGGIVALEIALALPESVRALVCLASGPSFCGSDKSIHASTLSQLVALRRGLKRSKESVGRSFLSRVHSLDSEVENRFLPNFLDISEDELRRGLDYLEKVDLVPGLSGLRVPTLLIHGDEDNVIPVGGSRRIQSLSPKAHLLELNGVEHDFVYQEDCQVTRHISEFLRKAV